MIGWRPTTKVNLLEALFYGLRKLSHKVSLDGACGIESMIRIAEAIGLEVERDYIKKGKRRGKTIGWYIQLKD